MKTDVKIFVIPYERVPAGPPEPPEKMEVEAPTLDALKTVTRERLKAKRYRTRSVSFAPGGLIAYVEEGQ